MANHEHEVGLHYKEPMFGCASDGCEAIGYGTGQRLKWFEPSELVDDLLVEVRGALNYISLGRGTAHTPDRTRRTANRARLLIDHFRMTREISDELRTENR